MRPLSLSSTPLLALLFRLSQPSHAQQLFYPPECMIPCFNSVLVTSGTCLPQNPTCLCLSIPQTTAKQFHSCFFDECRHRDDLGNMINAIRDYCPGIENVEGAITVVFVEEKPVVESSSSSSSTVVVATTSTTTTAQSIAETTVATSTEAKPTQTPDKEESDDNNDDQELSAPLPGDGTEVEGDSEQTEDDEDQRETSDGIQQGAGNNDDSESGASRRSQLGGAWMSFVGLVLFLV